MACNLFDSEIDSEFLGFTQSALDGHEHNLSETSDVESTASSSADDESENDDNNDGNADNTDEFGD